VPIGRLGPSPRPPMGGPVLGGQALLSITLPDMWDQPIAHMRGVFVIALEPGTQRLFLDRDADAEEADQDESEYDAPP
jgi:hypothetical protein